MLFACCISFKLRSAIKLRKVLRYNTMTVCRNIVQTETRAFPKNLATTIPCPDPPAPYIWYNLEGAPFPPF